MTTLKTGKALAGSFLLLIGTLACTTPVIGQTTSLPLNQEDKVEYVHAVETDSLPYLTLWDNAMEFLDSLTVPDQLAKEVMASDDLTELRHQFGFYLIVKPALTKQVEGVMMADLNMKFNGSGYEYSINNFRFIKYARNRFGVFVPKSSKKYPLENYYPDNQKKNWQTHFETINSKIQNIAVNLEQKMKEIRNSN